MSVSHTEAAVVARTKTVTRRLGWLFLKPGDRLTLCRKVMGRRNGEPLVRLAEVEVVDVRREPLWPISHAEIKREGVPVGSIVGPLDCPCEFCRRLSWAEWFARTMGCPINSDVTRIEWRYLAPAPESSKP